MAQHKVPHVLVFFFLCSAQFYGPGTSAQEMAPHAWSLKEARARAETGQADGQYQLGERYLEGRDVPRDRTLALAWFNLSAASGSRRASEERDKLEKTLIPAQVAEAESIVRNWKPKEFLETPELREFFRDQLRSLAIEAKLGFRVRREKKNDLMSKASGSEYWDTDFRLPGSTSQACEVVLGKDGSDDDAFLFCSIFRAPDQDTLGKFYAATCKTLMSLLPADWLYKGTACDSQPSFMKNSTWIETSPMVGYGVVLDMLYIPGRSETISLSVRSTDHCKAHPSECDGLPIGRAIEANSAAPSPVARAAESSPSTTPQQSKSGALRPDTGQQTDSQSVLMGGRTNDGQRFSARHMLQSGSAHFGQLTVSTDHVEWRESTERYGGNASKDDFSVQCSEIKSIGKAGFLASFKGNSYGGSEFRLDLVKKNYLLHAQNDEDRDAIITALLRACPRQK